MKALFAPDWRDGVPYQRLLAEALTARGVSVGFLRDYRRILPLTRLVRDWRREHGCDILHLHWPEAYYPRLGDGRDWWRCARFSTDLALATRRCALAVTAHNLHAHNRADEPFAFHNTRAAFRRAGVVFAHSQAAAALIAATYGVREERIAILPHGDLSAAMPPPVPRAQARARLALGDEKIVLMFGAVEPYKGIEAALAHWHAASPDATLVVCGKPFTPAYGESIASAAHGIPRVALHLARLSDGELADWLSAADAVLFNYRTIFTSGAASLARSWGIPLLLPAHLGTVDLAEPSPRVFRFSAFGEDFATQLQHALSIAPDFPSAAPWRAAIAWPEVARLTAEGYERAMRG